MDCNKELEFKKNRVKLDRVIIITNFQRIAQNTPKIIH